MATTSPPSTPPASSPPTRPASPSPSRTGFRALSRMGTMLRRNSSGFSFKGLPRSESKSSLRKEAMAQASSDEGHSQPSPVAESPVREDAATEAETRAASPPPAVHHPSPLVHEAKESPEPPAPAVLTEEPQSMPVPEVTPAPTPAPPTQSAPPAVAAPPEAPSPAPAPAPMPAPVPTATPTPAQAPAPEKKVVVISPRSEDILSPETVLEELEQKAPSTSSPPAPSVPAPPAAVQERAPDYFAWGKAAKKKASEASLDAHEDPPPMPAPVAAPAPAPAPIPPTPAALPEEIQHVDPFAASVAESFAWKDQVKAVSPKQSKTSLHKPPSHEQLVASPEQIASRISRSPSREELHASPRSMNISLSPKASKSSLASSYGQVVNVSSGGRQVSISVDPNSERRGRSRSRASIRVSFNDAYTDPFADPPENNQVEMPKHALSPIYSVNTPLEDTTPPAKQEEPQPPFPEAEPYYPQPQASTHSQTPTPVAMPLPALNEVTHTRNIREQPSGYSIGTSTVAVETAMHETDERLPLLPRAMPVPNPAPAMGPSKSAPEPPMFNGIDVTVPPTDGVAWPTLAHSFKSLGWSEHILPDSAVYYSNAELRVVTDIDLRNAKKLDFVMGYFDKKRADEPIPAPEGWELWLREAGAGKASFDLALLKNWVNHKAKILMSEPVFNSGMDVDRIPEDDRADMEYRYWTFMESHPAHGPLPENAHAEAMDALTWCYTDCLLPSQQTGPPPFAPQECQELMGLLRSCTGDTPSNRIVHTRIVARVLLRLAQWRQHYFRPDRPLPNETAKGRLQREHRAPIRRVFMDVIMSVLCLGIPYLFMDRTAPHRLDEEGGLRGSQGPLLVIGACACLVAAVILSASVTLLSLPGLDDIARLAGMIAILFSASSMVSSVVALFRYKADLERTIVYVGGEGLMVHSRRSIVMSLPVVFLAWAIAAFVTGITFYSFRGVTYTSKLVIRQPFVDYTHWAVVGSLGGLVGMLIVSALLSRR